VSVGLRKTGLQREVLKLNLGVRWPAVRW